MLELEMMLQRPLHQLQSLNRQKQVTVYQVETLLEEIRQVDWDLASMKSKRVQILQKSLTALFRIPASLSLSPSRGCLTGEIVVLPKHLIIRTVLLLLRVPL